MNEVLENRQKTQRTPVEIKEKERTPEHKVSGMALANIFE